jgi:acetyl-CoA acetyltransferase
LATLRPRHLPSRPRKGLTDPTCGLIMGKTAEILISWNITRREQDEFALRSISRRRGDRGREV